MNCNSSDKDSYDVKWLPLSKRNLAATEREVARNARKMQKTLLRVLYKKIK